MAISDTRGVRHVRCPKCHSVLQEPNVPVYQCGGCGTSLRAKISTVNTQEAGVSGPSSEGGLPPQSRHLGSSDVASTSASTPDAPTTRDQGTGTTSRCETGDLMSAREHHASEQVSPIVEKHASEQVSPIVEKHASEQVSPIVEKHSSEQVSPIVEKKGHDRSTSQEAGGSSEHRKGRDAAVRAERSASAPSVSVNFSRESSKDAAELQDSEKRREAKSEPDAERKKESGEAARPRSGDLAAATPVRSPDCQPAGDVFKMSPLHEKILKTVDELKGDLSELFSKSQEVKPRKPARPPRLPKQEGHVSRPAIPSSRARHAAAAAASAAAAVHHRGNAGYVGNKHGQVAPRGLPSRRYRRCRADPCGHDVRPAGTCRHSCCSHGKPECGSCRGHCCGSRAQEPAPRKKLAVAREAKRRAPPRQHCRPVLKGAPFIICSSCFTLVQLPAGFAVASNKVSKLRCGSCSTVLSYSYRDPDRKKQPPHSVDQCSTDGLEARLGEGGGGRAPPDLFAFIDDFAAAHGANYSYSTEDEQPLHVSRNSSFDTVVEPNGTAQSTSLHRLMGYGSASELLLRRSPSLYESSFDRRSTSPPDASMRYDRKGKGVCVDDADDVAGDDDSDEEYGGALKRSSVRGFGLTHGKGVRAPGAIRIRS